jgi:hypothetical protein
MAIKDTRLVSIVFKSPMETSQGLHTLKEAL